MQANGTGRRDRRSFAEAELQRLIEVSGLRGVVYLVAARTGIRRGELEQVEWRDIHLDTPQPFILVRASVSKNRREARQPLTPDAVVALLGLRAASRAEPYDRAFAGDIPRMDQFRKDLTAAEIPYRDGRGEYADFHSLRKTFGTMLTLAGVGQRTVMELMRHSDMRLTAKTYTDANMLPISDAMGSLIRFAEKKERTQIDAQELVASGHSVSATVPTKTNDSVLLTSGDKTFSPSETVSVVSSPEMASGSRGRIRTYDQSVNSRPLYH